MPEIQETSYQPTFELWEDATNDISDKKIGQLVSALIDFEVVEKTKSYLILRINNFFTIRSRRQF